MAQPILFMSRRFIAAARLKCLKPRVGSTSFMASIMDLPKLFMNPSKKIKKQTSCYFMIHTIKHCKRFDAFYKVHQGSTYKSLPDFLKRS